MNRSQVALRVVFVLHFLFSTWGAMAFLPASYMYMNSIILIFGFWAIVCPDSAEAVFMFLLLTAVSILLDAIFIGIFDQMHIATTDTLRRDTYRFSLGMSIVNLIIKPVTCFVMYRVYTDRGGNNPDFLPNIPGFGGAAPSSYENIDQPVPSNNIESASPHHTFEKPGPPN